MTRLLVLDASAIVALLLDSSSVGDWVAGQVAGSHVCAPELALVETSNILRRQQLRGVVTPGVATLAHEDLLALPIELWPYRAFAERAWELRENLTVYDASYVALAELLPARLLTLDVRLARAPGLTCQISCPPGL